MKGLNNSRKYLPLLCLVCIVLQPTKIRAQIEGQERQEKLSEKALAASKERENRINQELAQSKHNMWAGEYYYGDGLVVNVNLLIGKNPVLFLRGTVAWGWMILTTAMLSGGFQGIAPELVPVLWVNASI